MTDEELLHISLETDDGKKHRKIGRGGPAFNSKPISDTVFRNMITRAISAESVYSDNLKKAYFLINLNIEYHSPAVSDMLKTLKLDIKTVVSETQVIVGGDSKDLSDTINSKKILKKVTNPIRDIHVLEWRDKIGESLLDLIKKDVDKTGIFRVSISYLDNLTSVEEEGAKKILSQKLSQDMQPRYLKNSKQFICGSTSSRIMDIAKLSFVKRITTLPTKKPQSTPISEILYKKGEYEIIPQRDSPKLCVIDSGVSKSLAEYCHICDNYVFSNAYDTKGHGTKVISVAMFGEDLLNKSKRLTQKSDVISYKIDDNEEDSDIPLDEAIMSAVEKYSDETKVFSVSYNNFDILPEDRLEVARKLDIFLQEKNVLLVISGGNIDNQIAYRQKGNYPQYLANYPVYSPSEAKTAICVGSICKNSTIDNCVVSYNTRMGILPIFYHDELHKFRFFKPDIYTYGGNSELKMSGSSLLVSPDLEFPTINSNDDIVYSTGTSLSAPLIALSLAELYEKFSNLYSNCETYKAIILNKAHYAQVNNLPVFYLLNVHRTPYCDSAIYLNFEGVVTPKYRSEDIEKTNVILCKSTSFYMPEEADSIDIFTVHSNNYKFQDLRRYNTRVVVEIKKPSGVSLKKSYGTPNMNCVNTFAHYDFKRNYTGKYIVQVHVETRGIPKEALKDMKVRFGVSLRINIKNTAGGNIKNIYARVLASSKAVSRMKVRSVMVAREKSKSANPQAVSY